MTEVHRIDVLGFHCPVPVHEARKALKTMDDGHVLELVSDDPETLHDIPALIARLNVTLESVEENSGEYTFRIINSVDSPPITTIRMDENIPADALLPTSHGDFRIRVFHEENGLDHVALTLGDMEGPDPLLVRVHSECLTGDAFSSLRCDCGPQLDAGLQEIAERGWGALIYLRQEGRGIGLHAKIQAYHLQDKGADTLDANLHLGLPGDARDYEIAAEILKSIGATRISLLTNNPDKVKQLQEHGINVVERKSLIVGIGESNKDYLKTKLERMGHEIKESELDG
ncbi:MAG TPA: GTP cyclohydrolase II [Candidatus Thalassarchaeaceae archaeon]|nr:GTP cyclohydrolase II [Candidatus Thalassarchaeaceae archaeon]